MQRRSRADKNEGKGKRAGRVKNASSTTNWIQNERNKRKKRKGSGEVVHAINGRKLKQVANLQKLHVRRCKRHTKQTEKQAGTEERQIPETR